LNDSSSPFFVIFFFWDRVSWNDLLGLTLNHDPPNLCSE
jgi:hypothetical protein